MTSCDDCKHGKRMYCDGNISKDWFNQESNIPPKQVDKENFWTYLICARNKKGLEYLNVTGNCKGFENA